METSLSEVQERRPHPEERIVASTSGARWKGVQVNSEHLCRGGEVLVVNCLRCAWRRADALSDQLEKLKKEYDEEVTSHDMEETDLKAKLAAARSERDDAMAALDSEAAITNHILRHPNTSWPRERVERFALHLLGDEIAKQFRDVLRLSSETDE